MIFSTHIYKAGEVNIVYSVSSKQDGSLYAAPESIKSLPAVGSSDKDTFFSLVSTQ